MDVKRAILYCRVSTPGQVERGFSLRQQEESLRGYCDREGYEILEVISDEGWSGASLERPGMERLRDLVFEGGVSAVLAQDADRITREPGDRLVLDDEFKRSGAVLVALDDWGDDSHQGQLLRFLKGWLASGERKDFVKRTQRGKRRKAREGKVLGSGPPPYGFRFVKDGAGVRVGLAEDPATMPVVRRLFELVGGRGVAMYAAGRQLEREGHPAPLGGPWRVSVIKNIITRDAYRPHTAEELRTTGVSEDVISRLDPLERHGLHFSGKRRVTGPARGPRTYRKVPREEWIPVPVPDAGVPLEWVEAARENVRDNPKPAFGGGGRDHELSGGVLVCAGCGNRMTTSSSKTRGRTRWYYQCPRGRGGDRRGGCSHRRMHNAGALEAEVVALVDGELLVDRETLERHLEAAGPDGAGRKRYPVTRDAADALGKRLAEAGRKRAAYQDQQAAGLMTLDELAERLRALDSERSAVERGIERARHAAEHAAEAERARRAVLEMFGTGLMAGLHWFPPRLRRQVYGLMGLRVTVDADGALTLEGRFDADLMRLTPEVERYVEGLRAVDERLREAPAEGNADRLDRIERELAALRRRTSVRAGQATSG